MEFLSQFWLPIVVSAVFVWITSFFTHMVFPHHRKDMEGLPNEEQAMEALKSVKPGNYMFPYCTQKEMNSPEMKAKMEKGPMGLVTIFDGGINMGQKLIQTFLVYILIGVFVAYVGSNTLLGADTYLAKFRVCGAVAFCAHGLGWMSFAIWFKNIKVLPNLFDAILYALVTAGTFGWLWPK